MLNRLLIPPENSPTLSARRLHNLTFFNLSSATAATSLPLTPRIAAYKEI